MLGKLSVAICASAEPEARDAMRDVIEMSSVGNNLMVEWKTISAKIFVKGKGKVHLRTCAKEKYGRFNKNDLKGVALKFLKHENW